MAGGVGQALRGTGRSWGWSAANLGPELVLRAAVPLQPLPSLGGQGQGQAETGLRGALGTAFLSQLLPPPPPLLVTLRSPCQVPGVGLSADCPAICPGQQSGTQEVSNLPLSEPPGFPKPQGTF